jgi:hypothetical protein
LIRRSDESPSSWESFFAFRNLAEIPDDFLSGRSLNVVLEPGGVFDDER